MRRGKVRAVTIVLIAAMLALALLPSAVLAHNFCRYQGPVFCCNNVTEVSAWLEDPYVGPWTASLEGSPYGLTIYRLDIPPDDPDTPGKEGGVYGDTVHFMVTCNSTNITAQSADGYKAYVTGGVIYHPLDLCAGCPLQGDVNMDGEVNMADVTREEQIILGIADVTPCADVNGDGHIDMADVTCVQRIILGLPC